MIEWLHKHWFLLVALVAIGSAWGQQQNKIMNLEEAVKATASTSQKVETLQQQGARVDERTQAIQKDQAETKQLILQLLQGQRAVSRQLANQ